jgi:hypothetical protein
MCAVQLNLLAPFVRPNVKVRDQESEAIRYTRARLDRNTDTISVMNAKDISTAVARESDSIGFTLIFWPFGRVYEPRLDNKSLLEIESLFIKRYSIIRSLYVISSLLYYYYSSFILMAFIHPSSSPRATTSTLHVLVKTSFSPKHLFSS